MFSVLLVTPMKSTPVHITETPSPARTVPLNSAIQIINQYCNETEMDIHPSMGLLLYNSPNRDFVTNWEVVPVNDNQSFNAKEVLETVFNYSNSKATRHGENKHQPNPRLDIESLMTTCNDNKSTTIDPKRQFRMEPLVPTSSVSRSIATFIPSHAQTTWGDDLLNEWCEVLTTNIWLDENKLMVARKLGKEKEWQEVIDNLGDERFDLDRCPETGHVYKTRVNLEFARVCGKDFPIKLSNVEGKHFALVTFYLSTGLYVDPMDGKAELGNDITYELLRSMKIIDKGVDNRTFVRDLHDMMTTDNNVPFIKKLSKIKVHYLKQPIEDPDEIALLVRSFVSVSKSIADAKRGSNHSNSFDICANIVSEVQRKLTVHSLFVRPNYTGRNWLPTKQMTPAQLKERTEKGDEDNEYSILGDYACFIMNGRFKKLLKDIKNPDNDNLMSEILSAENYNAVLANQAKRVGPPFINTWDTVVEDAYPGHDIPGMSKMNTSKANIAWAFVKFLPLIYAEYYNKLDKDLEGDLTLGEMIEVGLTYHCNVSHSKGDMGIHQLETRFHSVLIGQNQKSLSISKPEHHMIVTAVLLAVLFDAALDSKYFTRRESHRANGRDQTWENDSLENELEALQQNLNNCRVCFTAISQQYSSSGERNFNCGIVL